MTDKPRYSVTGVARATEPERPVLTVVDGTKAHYKGGRPNRAFTDPTPHTGPNKSVSPYLPLLRARARDAVRNNPIAARAVDLLVSNLVGTGITPYLMGSTADRDSVRDVWERWTDEADADGRTDLYGVQAVAARAWVESGECFIRLRARWPEDGLIVPLQVQVLEADMVPLIDSDDPPTAGRIVRQGVEFDMRGRRTGYWFYPEHPGDRMMSTIRPGFEALRFVPADQVLHVAEIQRPGQIRGVPRMASALTALQQLGQFDEAALERAKNAAGITGFIHRPAPTDVGVDPVTGEPIDEHNVESSEIKTGSMYTLLPGEGVEFPALPDLGAQYGDFTRRITQIIAGAFGLTYEQLSGDYSQMNDRTARVSIMEARRRFQQLQWSVLIPQFCEPLWRRWSQASVLAGQVPQNVANRRVRHIPQAWEYINPVQDVSSKLQSIEGGLTSRSSVILERGDDPDEVDAERERDRQRERERGLSDEPSQEEQAQAQAEREREQSRLDERHRVEMRAKELEVERINADTEALREKQRVEREDLDLRKAQAAEASERAAREHQEVIATKESERAYYEEAKAREAAMKQKTEDEASAALDDAVQKRLRVDAELESFEAMRQQDEADREAARIRGEQDAEAEREQREALHALERELKAEQVAAAKAEREAQQAALEALRNECG